MGGDTNTYLSEMELLTEPYSESLKERDHLKRLELDGDKAKM
jgi:hypothetical protein